MLEDMQVKDLLKLMAVLKGENCANPSQLHDPSQYMIVRTYSAGVFAGYIQSRNGREVIMKHARRLWKWSGAASLSQLAMEGVSDPENCMFPCPVERVHLLEVVEILECSPEAKKSIITVKVWEK